MMDKLHLLEQKIDTLIQTLTSVKEENAQLKANNESMGKELSDLKKEYDLIKLSENDKNEKMKTSLTRILSRLDELEQIAS